MPEPREKETTEQWIKRIMKPLDDEIAKTQQIAKELMNWNLKLNFVEGLRSSKGDSNVRTP